MEFIGEIFIELIFRKIIIGIFGYYTLSFFYKITKNKAALEWLDSTSTLEGEEFGKGCLITIVGLISFSGLVTFFVYLFYK